MSGYAVTNEQQHVLETCLADLRVRSEARAVMVIDNDGRVLAQAPTCEQTASDTVSALAAGSFVAAHELARILGEKSFQSISHEGEEVSMYMERAANVFLVLVIFGSETIVGLVRLYTGKMIEEITPLLTRITGQSFAAMPGAPSLELDIEQPLFAMVEPE